MNVMACNAGAWLPFADPNVEEEKNLALLVTLVETEIDRKTVETPSGWEKKQSNLLRLLRSNNHMPEKAAAAWKEWVTWRQTLKVDEVSDEDIRYELSSGIAFWKGKDKVGRPCLVITGRMMDTGTWQGTLSSFKKFMVRMVEEGCQLADEAGQETISIIYDRRGLEYKHIDPVLHQLTRLTQDSLRTHYGSRLGRLYVVYANWFFYGAFYLILKPLLGLVSTKENTILLLSDEKGLLPHFDEDQICMLKMDTTTASYQSTLKRGDHPPELVESKECSVNFTPTPGADRGHQLEPAKSIASIQR